MARDLILKKFGLEIYRTIPDPPQQPAALSTDPQQRFGPGYGIVKPRAEYSPWTTDAEFQSVYKLIEGSTLAGNEDQPCECEHRQSDGLTARGNVPGPPWRTS
jgi:hypothetical protein